MNLKSLIDTLDPMPPDAEVVFDFGVPAGQLGSWRGVYAELSLYHGDKPRTVAQVLADARRAVGRSFTGYKGGRYVMNERTPVWADDYGLCIYRGLMGAAFDAEKQTVTLVTADLGDYR